MDELSVLTQAMKLEKEGKEFYLKAADSTDDAEAREMFRTLANDEVNHYSYIERQYNLRKDGKDWVPIPELDGVPSVDAGAPIFPRGKQAPGSLADKPNLEDSLLFGLGAEIKSYELYSQSAKQSKNPDAKQMFSKLAAAERGHFDTLMMRYESYFDYPR